MRRSFITFLVLSFTSILYGQNDSLTKILSETVCECFEGKKGFGEMNDEAFGDCLYNAMVENGDLMTKESIRLYGDTSQESGYKLANKLSVDIRVQMVYMCDDYFVFMDSVRYAVVSDGSEDSLRKELKWFNSKNKAPDSTIFFIDRGILKLQLKDINGAYKDLEKAVRLDKNNIAAHLFRGYALEMRKAYDRAISDFQYVAKASGEAEYDVIVAIVKRKKQIAEGIKK